MHRFRRCLLFLLVVSHAAPAVAQLVKPAIPLWKPIVDEVYLQEIPTHIPTNHPLIAVAVHEGRAFVGDANGVSRVDGDTLQHIHWLHRITVLLGLGAVGFVALAAANLREPSDGVRLGAWAVVALYVAQIAVGALNIFTSFSTGILVAHLAFAAAIWAVLAVTVVAGRYRPSPVEVRLPSRSTGTQPRPPETSPSRVHAAVA